MTYLRIEGEKAASDINMGSALLRHHVDRLIENFDFDDTDETIKHVFDEATNYHHYVEHLFCEAPHFVYDIRVTRAVIMSSRDFVACFTADVIHCILSQKATVAGEVVDQRSLAARVARIASEVKV